MSTPASRIETTSAFDRQMRSTDRPWQARILAYLIDVGRMSDPRLRGRGLTADHGREWRYRVGDYRIIVRIDDATRTILALAAGHRSRIYGT